MLVLTCLLAVSVLSGCKSMRRDPNPAGVFGSGIDFALDDSLLMDSHPLGDRFTGGTEHRDLFTPVYFAFDSSTIPAGERGKVELVARHLNQNRQDAVIIEGHTDERGSREYNLALGERRALSVRSYLIDLGISPDRIQTISFGKEQPAVLGQGEEIWAKNRRGEFVIYRRP